MQARGLTPWRPLAMIPPLTNYRWKMGKLVKATGQWVAKDGTGTAICYYDEEFVMDDAVKTLEQARSILHAGLLTQRMQEKANSDYPNFKRWRTCEVVEFEQVAEKAKNSDLEKLMLEATELECVPENIDSYKRADYKAKALKQAIEQALLRKKQTKKDAMQDIGEVE